MCDPAKTLDFLEYIGTLKQTKRTGWVENGVENVESVADHMYRMGIVSLLSGDKELNTDRLIKVSLVHDIAESVIGDISPKQMRERGLTKEAKSQMEKQAMQDIANTLGGDTGAELLSLWNEYEDSNTKEGLWVKDIDRLEMCIQAFEYERNQGVDLSGFYTSIVGRLKDPWLISLGEELMSRREAFLKTTTLTAKTEKSACKSCLGYVAALGVGVLVGKLIFGSK
eukprot:TRINITY_DN16068_c0_g1_i1.p1 TRINITY_DN16068_c0_g1~~TRINITY_DN16068_c0_g1_i1.p1  ORF type:complete len:226 (+),score=39.23 TRINITY_DN16068_c0_g1_i1:78-755(+)